jgi:hypothetical protein
MRVAAFTAGEYKGMTVREARIWATLVVGIAYWENIALSGSAGEASTFGTAVTNILDNGAFDVFAWALVLVRCFGSRDGRAAPPRLMVATVLLGAIALVPVRLGAALALALLGGLMFAGPGVPGAIRQIRLVLFALAIETVWTAWPLAPLHVLVGGLDAWAVAGLLQLFGHAAIAHGNVVENLDTGFSLAVWPYCASSFPLASVALAFVTMVFYRGGALRLAHLGWLALSFLAGILLTESRLTLMATDDASYQWWHSGPGLSVYALAALGLSVVAPIVATWGTAADPGDGAPGDGVVARRGA